jgi:hypothetical protein
VEGCTFSIDWGCSLLDHARVGCDGLCNAVNYAPDLIVEGAFSEGRGWEKDEGFRFGFSTVLARSNEACSFVVLC